MAVMQFEWAAGSADPSRRVRVFCSDRRDGLSAPPWDAFNLALHVGDDAFAVQGNRHILVDSLGVPVAWAKQVHGIHVHRVVDSSEEAVEADALVTTASGIALSMMVADCLPVLFSHRSKSCVVAAHAGWRGLSGGVLEAALASMADATGDTLAQVAAETSTWLGPCIGPKHFEVGQEVWDAFAGSDPMDASCFTPSVRAGHHMADLAGLARRRLTHMGISVCEGNDSSSIWCTHANPERFFSHRRDTMSQGSTGRMAFGIWIAG